MQTRKRYLAECGARMALMHITDEDGSLGTFKAMFTASPEKALTEVAAAVIESLDLGGALVKDSLTPRHQCPDWDLMVVEPGSPEAECCTCKFPEIPDSWECPIGKPNCTQNCGAYGCGN